MACVQAPGNGSGVQAAGERRAARGGSAGAAGLDPGRDGLRVGSGFAAQLRRLPLERLAGLAFTGALEDSGDFGQQISAPGGSSRSSATAAASSASVSSRHRA